MRTLFAAAVAFVALGGTARAADVQVALVLSCGGDPACEKYAGQSPHDSFQFTAAPGEENDVTIRVQGTTALVHDDGATLTAGRLCTSTGAHDATCDVSGTPRATYSITLGDAADRLAIDGKLPSDTSIDGGAGDDTLSGGDEDDHLTGGAGSDRMLGGAGSDDFQAGASVEPDVMDGGADFDVVDYSARTTGVRVDLTETTASEGEPGEADTITGVENARGGSGDDRLLGDDGPNGLSGGPGADMLFGRGGADELAGDEGVDSFHGGAGDDAIDPNDGRAEPVACGSGNDLVAGERVSDEYGYDMAWIGPDTADVLAHDCEAVTLLGDARVNPFRVDPRVRRRGSVITLHNPCRTRRAPRKCSGTLTASVKGAGKAAKIGYSRRGRNIGVRLSHRARQAAAAGTPIALRIAIKLRSSRYSTGFSVLLPTA